MTKNNHAFFHKKNPWSEVKDRLLQCYLPAYFQKILLTPRPVCYVDCFAGKGKFDDGKLGSPNIALQIRDSAVEKSQKKGSKIEFILIELNHAEDLKVNIQNYSESNGKIEVIASSFEDKIKNLLSCKQRYNVFLYIDPYGIKALDCGIFDWLAHYPFGSIEMLINMNSFGFFRDACRVMKVDYSADDAFNNLTDIVEYEPTEVDSSPQSTALLTNIAGGDYWIKIVSEYRAKRFNGYAAEKLFSTEYKRILKQKFRYVLDMPIRLKAGHHPKYRMIHVTNHADGCNLMAKNMSSRSDELYIEIQNPQMLSLFERNVESNFVDERDIFSKMNNFLCSNIGPHDSEELLASFYTEFGVLCKDSMITKIWKKMENEEQIIVNRSHPTTINGQKSTYFRRDKNKYLTIMRKLP
jgi:three-Cys-motif partner protein